jgi:hypothetical protein
MSHYLLLYSPGTDSTVSAHTSAYKEELNYVTLGSKLTVASVAEYLKMKSM